MPMDVLMPVLGLVVGGLLGWFLRARLRRDPLPDVLGRLASELRAGRRPDAGGEAPEGMRAVREALDARWALRNEERQQALREALGRIAAFLREGVRGPLAQALNGDVAHLREGARTALGAIQDLEFFLREPLEADEAHNLVPVVQQVTREFTADWEVAVRLRGPDHPVRARIHRDTFMDALYLLLHNAGQFGGQKTVDVSVTEEDGRAVVTVRDHGAGFTAEALERAHDLFYTTTESGLGLGIPFARKIVESLGGEIRLRNPDGGGAEVTLSLPRA
jgi:signal transduction histidine kinase